MMRNKQEEEEKERMIKRYKEDGTNIRMRKE